MCKLRILVTILFLFTGMGFNVNAQESVRAKAQDCRLITSKDAVKKAQKKTGGKVVSVKLKRKGKNSEYKVRVLVGEKRIKNISIKACR
ncbi:PepSY domain-containing protein [Aliikangiella coralliicola]|uniref:PepSY domain-containing protein n=1 Tax=Aliikangiella coralliicola TaxID=2592383 RepID=A0A545U606_9GAMM|nr:hypothetical protein [Aliikangiella coralliicola]TQV84902.1 hypothetical protein FLL46_21125 [Aliikangiella coralliicola]